MKHLALTVALAVPALNGYACSLRSGWQPPTPQVAFDRSAVVVQARVISHLGDDRNTVTVEVRRVLKGTFTGNTVEAQSSSMCGMPVIDGTEYVFFFSKGSGYAATFANQPANLTAEGIVALLPKEAQQNASPAPLPELPAPSGQFLQSGFRRIPPTTNDAEPSVNVQIDTGSAEKCAGTLEKMRAAGQVEQTMGGATYWCSPTSAGDELLRFYGELKNKLTGKQLRIETSVRELCEMNFGALAGGQVPGDKIEVVTACQAKK